MKTYLVTGAAGFVGYHVAEHLLTAGNRVIGVDNLSPYYDICLKRDRLAELERTSSFSFHQMDIAEHETLQALCAEEPLDAVIHLAAQAGVRHSLDHPFDYAAANLTGHLSILELCRHHDTHPFLVYASSSSVYGASRKLPYSERDRADTPVSLYAATKRADELMSQSYAHLFALKQVGLRFFTVYGPWGRPDMAYWRFTENILGGKPIRIFNHGRMQRDLTHISDILGAIDTILAQGAPVGGDHRLYNIGGGNPVSLMQLVEAVETACGRTTAKVFEDMQPGDVHETAADVSALKADYGYAPSKPFAEGISEFVAWYRRYYGV